MLCFFFFNDTATTEIYTLSLHDALPIWCRWCWPIPSAACSPAWPRMESRRRKAAIRWKASGRTSCPTTSRWRSRSEEHTSELQSRQYLVCRLLLEKKKKKKTINEQFYIV